MARVVRCAVAFVLLVPALAACGARAKASPPPDLRSSAARTIAAGSARFTLTVTATVAGVHVLTSENGAVSFRQRRAHVYKLSTGTSVPQELILVGPYTYTNANVQAALANPGIRPWTKLDTRQLSPAQRRREIDDRDHVRALAYLAGGVVGARELGPGHLRGTVHPARVLARVPRPDRAAIGAAIRSDYAVGSFRADFWLDARDRVRRVRVDYRTAKGGRIVVDGSLSSFGAAVDVKLPPANEIEDISP
jgi:hypothetical protein